MKHFRKVVLALIFTTAVASRPICPVSTETRIIGVINLHLKQGNTATIAAQGQLNEISRWADIGSEYLYFTVSDNNGQEIFNKREKMSFWDGSAAVNLDTNNLTPGNYTIHVKFIGNKYLRPCEAYASLIICKI